jgi:hypothetical protein
VGEVEELDELGPGSVGVDGVVVEVPGEVVDVLG